MKVTSKLKIEKILLNIYEDNEFPQDYIDYYKEFLEELEAQELEKKR